MATAAAAISAVTEAQLAATNAPPAAVQAAAQAAPAASALQAAEAKAAPPPAAAQAAEAQAAPAPLAEQAAKTVADGTGAAPVGAVAGVDVAPVVAGPSGAAAADAATAASSTAAPAASADQAAAPAEGVEEILDERFDYSYNVVVIGNVGVGKTHLLKSLSNWTLVGDIAPTADLDEVNYYVNVHPSRVRLQIRDTACTEDKFKKNSQQYFDNVDAIVLVYDLTNYPSFTDLEKWEDVARRCTKNLNPEYMIIANKTDIKEQRQFEFGEPDLFARLIGAEVFKASAVTGENVKASFTALARRLHYKAHPEMRGDELPLPQTPQPEEEQPTPQKSSCIIL